MKKAEISVIVPVYNAAEWIEQCIQSVLNQTFKEFELILVDDGSTDNSYEICECFAKTDDRIRLFHKENGGGAGEARNYGVLKSEAEFLMFLDADDYYKDDLLEKMYMLQTEGGDDLVVCGYYSLDEKGGCIEQRGLKEEKIHGSQNVRDYFVKHYPDGLLGYPWNKLYRRKIIIDNHIEFPKMRRLEDGIFNVAYFRNIHSVCIINEPLVYYRTNSQVLLKKLPYDFYDDMKRFSKTYYDFLKEEAIDYHFCEDPFVIYFLNDFVCCLENILMGSWENIGFKEKKEYINQLRKEKLVIHMLKKTYLVPRYSRCVLQLFSLRQIIGLRLIICFKFILKKYFDTIFLALKKKFN